MPAKKTTTKKKDEAFEAELAARQKAEPEPQTAETVLSEAEAAPGTDLPDAEVPAVPSDAAAVETSPHEVETAREAHPDEQAGGVSPVAPASSELVEVVAQPTEHAAYSAMERADEVQIIEAIEGRMSETLVYNVPGKGQDLSWVGVREAIRMIVEDTGRNIRITDAPPIKSYETINGEQHVSFMAYAFDEASGQGYWGEANQPVRMALKKTTADNYRKSGKHVYDDDTVDDEFASRKALAKAQRNALKYFIPENIRQGILAIAQNDPRKLREITMGRGAPMENKPAALSDEEGQKLIAECRELYKAIGREFPEFKAKVPPGRFNSDLQAAWSSHEALRTLKGQLEEARDAYKAAAA